MNISIKNKNIVLVGLMGSGKSSTGLALANMLGRPIFSTDQIIEKQEGKTITQIFAEDGEEYFRELEKRVIKDLSDQKEVVIDCGGGVFVDADNRKELKKNGVVIYLYGTVETLYKRVSTRGNRPLLKVEDPKTKLQKLLEEREKYYKEAELTLPTDGKTPQEVADDLMKVIKT